MLYFSTIFVFSYVMLYLGWSLPCCCFLLQRIHEFWNATDSGIRFILGYIEGFGYPRFDSRLQQLNSYISWLGVTREVGAKSDDEPTKQGKTIDLP